jgi:hypothetical protein
MRGRKCFVCILLCMILAMIFPVSAQTWQVNSEFWAATDALGRKAPDWKQVGNPRNEKYVAMFYWTWHTDDLAAYPYIIDISKILRKNPEAAFDNNHPAWNNIVASVNWWGEPLLGYYRTTDAWVLRKHAEMLADAGVDVVFFDCTNGSFTWKSSYTKLLETWAQARQDGVKTPQIAFLMPFSATDGAAVAMQELYNDLYQPGLYKDLWFIWNGKPLMMAYPEALATKIGDTAGMKFTAASAFKGVEVTCPSWSDNFGNLTFKLYKWQGSYSASVAGTVIAESTFVNFSDNAGLRLRFPSQDAGAFIWELSKSSQVVGVWKYTDSKEAVTSYFNGRSVTGNYMSRIFYTSNSDFTPLATGTAQTPVQIGVGTDPLLMTAIKNFFTFRPGQPDYVNGPTRTDHWGWLERYPQHGYAKQSNSTYEQVTVGVSQNASDRSSGHCSAFNMPDTYGRSYTRARGQDPDTSAYVYGANFQEQWKRAFELDPKLVWITGWNEWIMGRYINDPSWPNPFAPFSCVDEYNWEKSRDIEPVQGWGAKGDAYYMQLVQNVRRFKGVHVQEQVSVPKTVHIGRLNEWTDVTPEFQDYKGDVLWRDAKGQGNDLVYINRTGRNDIVQAKIARDDDFIYFYVETDNDLTPATDANWMRLFIDVDRDKATGWEGYDYVLNRLSPQDSLIVEKNSTGWNWQRIGAAIFAVQKNMMEIKLARSLLALNGKELDFEFKWSDNLQQEGNVMDFYVSGDAAPGGRFNFVYSEQKAASVGATNSKPVDGVLYQNYPNPFNPDTVIHYRLAAPGAVSLRIFDIKGRLVAEPVQEKQAAGEHECRFDGTNLPAGIYVYKLAAGMQVLIKKMILIK